MSSVVAEGAKFDRATPPERSRVVETHSATLLFRGDRVYKRKKPVRFPFLDFSTPDARRDACRREVALNSRLSPDVYLGVETVLGPDGEPCDYLIAMRRMPEERRLAALLGSEEVHDRLREVARVMAVFHARAATSPEIDSAGTRDAVAQNWSDNFDEMRPFAGRYLDSDALARAEDLARRFLAGRKTLFDRRMAAGKVRDGHGDLLADDIFCLPDGPRILDCVEFSDLLRYGDVLSDVAFLAMDLERLERPDLAGEFLSRYREFSAEDAPDSLAHHYVAYRAQVRSKVACLRAEQGDPDAAVEAGRLLEITVRHLERARVRLVLVGGLPGTGKTTLTHLLSDDRGWVHVHSDETRKELAGLSSETPAPAAFGAGIYGQGPTRSAYRAMIARARAIIALGESVVLDASWTDAILRDEAAATAFASWADLIEVRCRAPAQAAAARIARRRAAGVSASDATPEIASLLARRADPWPSARGIDTGGSQLAALRALRRAVEARPEPNPYESFFVPPSLHRPAM